MNVIFEFSATKTIRNSHYLHGTKIFVDQWYLTMNRNRAISLCVKKKLFSYEFSEIFKNTFLTKHTSGWLLLHVCCEIHNKLMRIQWAHQGYLWINRRSQISIKSGIFEIFIASIWQNLWFGFWKCIFMTAFIVLWKSNISVSIIFSL